MSMIKDEDTVHTVLDILQDSYVKAFAYLDSFQGDTRFLPWIRQIAAALRVPESAVKSRLLYGCRKIEAKALVSPAFQLLLLGMV